MPGIMTSVTTRSGRCARTAARACAPSATRPRRDRGPAGCGRRRACRRCRRRGRAAAPRRRRGRRRRLAGGAASRLSSGSQRGPRRRRRRAVDGAGDGRAATCGCGRWAVPRGIVTVKVLPTPGRLSTPIVAAVQLDELLHEREADAGALVGAGAGALDAVEPFEDVRGGRRRGCRAGVADGRGRRRRRRCASAHVDLAGERELEGVGEEVEDDLLPHGRDRRARARRAGGSRR
jgi:hypothetical protein